jgi:hypothetical protein
VNLQLDHFSDGICVSSSVKKQTHFFSFFFPSWGKVEGKKSTQNIIFLPLCRACAVQQAQHNVSRWMTWLPISLKNAVKCDKWYQLQNLSITESLNAKGAREKFLVDQPRACRSQCRSKTTTETTYFHEVSGFAAFSVALSGDSCVVAAGRKNASSAKSTSKPMKTNITLCFTDLSTAGPPAELKHITQRRKRKQP